MVPPVGNSLTVRRSGKLAIAPLVLGAMAVLAVFGGPGPTAIAIAVAVYWIIAAVADYRKVLTLSPESIELTGYIGGPVVIRRSDVVTCRYIRYRPKGRGAEMSFFEVTDSSGRRVKIWRFWWGPGAGKLFAALEDWLAGTPVDMPADARERLRALAAR